MGLAGLAVGGVGVAAAVRAYLEGKTETIATLKTLGATGGTVFAVYLTQIGLLSLLGHRASGWSLGAALPLIAAPFAAERLPVPAEFGIYPRAAGRGGALRRADRADLHALAAGAGARHPRGRAVPRPGRRPSARLPRPVYIAAIAALAAALVGIATVLSGATELALGPRAA